MKKEIHPFWFRERVNGDDHIDKGTQQRLFDPTKLKENIEIDNLNLSRDFLEITFNDGVYTKLAIQSILKEFTNNVDEIFSDKNLNKIEAIIQEAGLQEDINWRNKGSGRNRLYWREKT